MQSEQIGELAKALAAAQGEIENATKDTENTFFKSSYADMASVWEACRKPLSKNGIGVVQATQISDDGSVLLVTTLMHSSGQWIKSEYPVRPVKADPQGLGSAHTYARRFSLQGMAGVAPSDDDSDDDGNEASGQTDTATKSDSIARPETNGASKAKPLTGPIKTRAELRTAVEAFYRDLASVGSLDEFIVFKESAKALLDQIETDQPRWWEGEGDAIGMKYRVQTRERELLDEDERRAIQGEDSTVMGAA